MMQSQESSSFNYQEQIKQPFKEELFLALKEEIKNDKDSLEMQWPNKETNMIANMETKMDANMIANIETDCMNINKERCPIIDRIAIQVEKLEKNLKEQSSRQLLSHTKTNDIRECENET